MTDTSEILYETHLFAAPPLCHPLNPYLRISTWLQGVIILEKDLLRQITNMANNEHISG
jgi:hypothetical protein